jgi:N-acyl-D-aspartate/D-glutamate deacylase
VHDLVIKGGRVVDPATGTDAHVDVAITGSRIAAVAADLDGTVCLDASGCVVAPGFVDLHSHAQSIGGHRLQAMDGVTTALDLEAGAVDVNRAYADAAAEGRPLHYGFSASWCGARQAVLADVTPDGQLATLLAHLGNPAWHRAADGSEQDRVLAMLSDDLAAGALGIGVLIGYAPQADPVEYLRVAALGADAGRPVYTHARDLVDFAPDAPVDGAEEIVRAAAETGAHMHYCHVNSTSLHAVDRVLGLVERAQHEGSVITTEAYPYGAGATAIGAAFLSPERLHERGLTPADLVYVPTGERVADAARLLELRSSDPGGLTIVHFLDDDERADRQLLMRSLTFPGACIASDAMPLTWQGPPREHVWPLPSDVQTHPRTAGTYARSFRRLVVENNVEDIAGFVRRASVLPAAVLAAATHGEVQKGSLAVGRDADVVVLDTDDYRDQASYSDATRISTGVRHLIVGGTQVVRSGVLDAAARPGAPVRA